MIEINDCFRLRKLTHWSKRVYWYLQEWEPSDRPEGRWTRITANMTPDNMDKLLVRMECPQDALERFREAT